MFDGKSGNFGVLGASLLIMFPPWIVFILWDAIHNHDGSLIQTLSIILEKGFINYVKETTPDPCSSIAWKMIAIFSFFELFLMRFVPGKEFKSTITPKGNTPIYKANGLQCYTISVVTYILGAYLGFYKFGLIYDNLGSLLVCSNIIAMLLCVFLSFKGLYFPSTSDNGSNGNIVLNFFWGTELYPRIFGWDVKLFTNCRYGMMFWAIGLISYAGKQYEHFGYIDDGMFVSVVLQLAYITKFFWWETGYFCSMDIQHDRAGYYLCWGCMVYLPATYTSPSMFLVMHPANLGLMKSGLILFLGLLCIWINYDADHQRQHFRKTQGKCKIWGKKPEYIPATYTTDSGEKKENLLLTSGWWGLSRHFHYIPEIMSSFFWSVSAGFGFLIPYFYAIYLTILLFHRAFRDDQRCAAKYQKDWDKYKKRVKYHIIPKIY